MHFIRAYFVLAIATALLTPVVHPLPSKTPSKREEMPSNEPINMVQACMNGCYNSIKPWLEERSLFDDLIKTGCTYQNRDNSNLPLPCSEPREAFKRAVVDILDSGENCRSGCLKDHPVAGPPFYDSGSCTYFKINETKVYTKGCWEAAGTSIFKNQFQDTCQAVWLHRTQEDTGVCCRIYGCANY